MRDGGKATAFWFRIRTLRFRHKEAFQFFLLNFLLQLTPFGVALLELASQQTRLNPAGHTEAAWTLLAFGLWNAPASLRQDISKPERSDRIKIIFYSVAFATTFVIFWTLFEQSSDEPTSAEISTFYVGIPLVLAAAACFIIGAINYALLKPTSVRLLWRHQSQFSGIYVAKYFGYFAMHGLKVDIKPADPTAINSALDHFGGCHFAIVSSTDVVKARANGIKMRAIQVIVPEPAISFLARQETDIRDFSDFKGKRVAYRKGYEEGDVLRVMLHSVGLGLVDIIAASGGVDCEEFIDGTADIVAGHEAIEPLALARRQIFVRTIQPVLHGRPIFADTLVTTEQTIRVIPSLARGMSAAVQAGWESVAENPRRGIDATLYEQRDYSQENRAFQSEIQDAMLGLRGDSRMLPRSLLPFGTKEADWLPIINGMEAAGLVQPGLRPSEMYWL